MKLDFQRSPGHLIRRCLQLHGTLFAEHTNGYGITSPQWAAIRALHECPGVEQAKLAELIAYDRSTIGTMVDRLEAKGLVERSADAADRRLKRLNLTPAGHVLFEKLHERVRAVSTRFVAPLSKSETEQLLSLLERLLEPAEAG
jgi:DNA-binding MarR family transcriptional regulator